MLKRYSSRRKPLDAGFLTSRLTRARSYDRIAGYFSSSILEVAGEALESIEGKVRVVCNSSLSRADVEVAKAAQAAMANGAISIPNISALPPSHVSSGSMTSCAREGSKSACCPMMSSA